MELITLWTAVEMTENSSNAHEKLLGAAAAGAKIIVLPRHFDSLYGCQHFPSYALPPAAHPEVYFRSYLTLSAMAKDTGTQASWTMTWVEKGARGLTTCLARDQVKPRFCMTVARAPTPPSISTAPQIASTRVATSLELVITGFCGFLWSSSARPQSLPKRARAALLVVA